MESSDRPPEEVAAIDEVFRKQPPVALPPEAKPAGGVPDPPPEVKLVEPEVPAPPAGDPAAPRTGSPLGDPARELQREYEEQDDESEFLP